MSANHVFFYVRLMQKGYLFRACFVFSIFCKFNNAIGLMMWRIDKEMLDITY
jgi:hypothetical protein